jgi:hypothetical protein
MPYYVQKASVVTLVNPSETKAYYIGDNRWSFIFSDRVIFSTEKEAKNTVSLKNIVVVSE